MSIAVTKGKISRSGSNLTNGSEDLLTASVFGPIRYLPSEMLLFPILGRAENLNGKFYEPKSVVDDTELNIEFWPRYPRCEPDVSIKIGEKELIFVEAKFHSGKSGTFQADDKEAPVDEAAVSDQLAREWLDLCRDIPDKRKSLVYLTAHRTMPKSDIEDSAKEFLNMDSIDSDSFKDNTYWLSWFDVWDEAQRKFDRTDDSFLQIVLKDIVQLLERLELKHFTGFTIGVESAIDFPEPPIFYQSDG
jgi:hypothetical protein